MASVLRRPALETDRVQAATPPLLVDPDWQSLLDEATDCGYRQGYDAGRARGEAEIRASADQVAGALQAAVENVRTEIAEAGRLSSRQLLTAALDLIERLAGELTIDADILCGRIEEALAELDGAPLQVRVASADAAHVRAGLSSDPRVEVVDDPALEAGEARITGEWCEADLRREAVLGVLREALGA